MSGRKNESKSQITAFLLVDIQIGIHFDKLTRQKKTFKLDSS